MAAFAFGIILALSATGSYLVPAVGLGLLAPLIAARRPWRRLGWVGVGVLWAVAFTAAALDARPPPDLTGGERVLVGRVAGLPEHEPGQQRFLVDPSYIEGLPPGAPLPRYIRLSWYGEAPKVRAGETWRWTVRLRRPRGHLNPGAFDYERWLFGEHVDATGYVRQAGGERLAGPSGLQAVRARISAAIGERLGTDRAAAVIAALTVGDARGFTAEFWEILRRTGTTHLMVISALNIGVVSFLVYALALRLWRRCPRLAERCPAPVAAALMSLVSAIGYGALAGLGLSTRRALIMMTVVLVAVAARRAISRPRVLTAAAAAVLALDAAAAVTPGFWLSFGAVAVILLTIATAPIGEHRWGTAVRVQLALTVGLAPLLAVWFGAVPLLSAPVNLLVVPLFAVFVPVALGGLALAGIWPDAGWLVLGVLHGALEPVLAGLETVASMGDGRLALPSPPTWALLAAAAGTALLLLPRGTPGRRVALPMLAALLVAGVARPLPGGWRLTVLDVGQGLSAVLETRGHVLVYDTGPAWDGGDAAGYSLVPYLRSRGVARVDLVVVSHGDRDHAGGLGTLLGAVDVAALRSGEPLARRPAARRCVAGQAWTWDGVRFEFLWPPPTGLTGNASSCVLRVSGRNGSVLLTGDIGIEAEQRMVAAGNVAPADVLVIPHHGSGSSSSKPFVRAATPALAVVSAGYRNSYGHPDPAVVRRYRCSGARVLSTALDGAVVIRSSAQGITSPVRLRQTQRRLFHEPEISRFQRQSQIHYDSCTLGTAFP